MIFAETDTCLRAAKWRLNALTGGASKTARATKPVAPRSGNMLNPYTKELTTGRGEVLEVIEVCQGVRPPDELLLPEVWLLAVHPDPGDRVRL